MIDRFTFYRLVFPFRFRRQNRLREERLGVDVDAFVRSLEDGDRRLEIARFLWEILREQAFLPDFRPMADDDLARVYAMGPEEVRDEVIDPLLAKLELKVDGIDFTGFDFSSIVTPHDVSRFVMRVAAIQAGQSERRFTDGAG
jgi:hypothetical protein